MMELDTILTNSKWEILKELSKNPKSPIELAKYFKTTVANMSQQLKILEAYGIISKTKIQNSEKGKPRTQYYITTDINFIIKLSKTNAIKQQIKKDPINDFTLNILTNINKKDQYYLLKTFFDYTDIFEKSSIGYLKTNEKNIELFLITNNLNDAREKISNLEYQNTEGVSKKIVVWSHNKEEIDNGIKQKDKHFLTLIKDSQILLDETNLLQKYQDQIKELT